MAAIISPLVIDTLLLGQGDRRRQLQDFPILVDVWSEFAQLPSGLHELLVSPHRDSRAADVAALVEELAGPRHDPEVAHLQGVVAARLGLQDLWRVLLPATSWWSGIRDDLLDGLPPGETLAGWISALLRSEASREASASIEPTRPEQRREEAPVDALPNSLRQLTRLGLLFGALDAARNARTGRVKDLKALLRIVGEREVASRGVAALAECDAAGREMDVARAVHRARIFNVSVNRRAEYAVTRSVPAIKADAARQLFSISCREISWAVIDSGIDAAHPAFVADHDDPSAGSRVRATYDFGRIRAILSRSNRRNAAARETLAAELAAQGAGTAAEVSERLLALAEGLSADRPVDWTLVEPLLLRPDPAPPAHPHGTHVAGILGAHWRDAGARDARMLGVCPDIRLYDLRVLGPDAEQTEFAVIAALQFVRHLNARNAFSTIDGVNLSLSIPHNVRNYACGRTPVCLEAEALAAAGTVVVAAAGNRGYQRYRLADDTSFESYAASSITDPGNADAVITVGATHRYWPHTYGVSFFSSRGPTGDGRLKPDLLAPGERIESTTPDGGSDAMDGTSMAAPHVSGAAALLMARHRELKGNPRRIKEVLCATATDLGRERSFQGNGMVDVLRAIQAL